MANKIIQATALPTGEQAQLILIDNGDGTFTQTVAFDRDTYPSRAADIVPGSAVLSANGSLLPALTGISYPQAIVRAAASGNVDIYTAPVGKRVLVGLVPVFNPTIGAITAFLQLKSSSVYYRLTANVVINPNTASFGLGLRIVLEPGESISINTTALGLNVFAKVMQYDSFNGLYAPKLLALANGNNTVYTVPTGKTALGLSGSVANEMTAASGLLFYENSSGNPRSITWFLVPNGQSADTTTQASAATSVNDSTVNSGAAGSCALGAGDRIIISTNAATAIQWAYALIAEV